MFYDGYQSEALSLSHIVQEESACPPSTRLAQLVALGLRVEGEFKSEQDASINSSCIGGIDLDFETESSTNAPPLTDYETVYVTSHKGPCRAGAFSPDGSLVATGSVDTSIKILDTDKMIAKSSGVVGDDSQAEQGALHPVIRTLYDHQDEVTCLEFHPHEQILISGSDDCTVKIYDFAKPSVKRAQRTIQETYPVRAIAMHPAGDHLLVGTLHPTLRLYDINTIQCFVASNPTDQHREAPTSLCFNNQGTMYASASEDGDIKIWDAISSRKINIFPKAHDGIEVCSISFSKNGKYLLSSGKDSLVKLWELSMSRCLIAYASPNACMKQQFRARACFTHTEDFVIYPDERTNSLSSWNSRNAERKLSLTLGHNSNVRFICHSPNSAAFLSCSDDYRARFWYRKVDPPIV